MENYNPLRTKAVVCFLISDMCKTCFNWVWEMDVVDAGAWGGGVISIGDDDGRLMAVLVLLLQGYGKWTALI